MPPKIGCHDSSSHVGRPGHGPHASIRLTKSSTSTTPFPPTGEMSAGHTAGGAGQGPHASMRTSRSSTSTSALPEKSGGQAPHQTEHNEMARHESNARYGARFN